MLSAGQRLRRQKLPVVSSESYGYLKPPGDVRDDPLALAWLRGCVVNTAPRPKEYSRIIPADKLRKERTAGVMFYFLRRQDSTSSPFKQV